MSIVRVFLMTALSYGSVLYANPRTHTIDKGDIAQGYNVSSDAATAVDVQTDAIVSVEHIDIHNPVVLQISANVLNLIYIDNNQSSSQPQPCYPCIPECSSWESCWEYPENLNDVPCSAPYSAPCSISTMSYCERDNDMESIANIMQDDVDEVSYLENAPANWSHWKAWRAAFWSFYLLLRSKLPCASR